MPILTLPFRNYHLYKLYVRKNKLTFFLWYSDIGDSLNETHSESHWWIANVTRFSFKWHCVFAVPSMSNFICSYPLSVRYRGRSPWLLTKTFIWQVFRIVDSLWYLVSYKNEKHHGFSVRSHVVMQVTRVFPLFSQNEKSATWISSKLLIFSVDQPGLEPGTSRLWVCCSNQLSYKSNYSVQRYELFVKYPNILGKKT